MTIQTQTSWFRRSAPSTRANNAHKAWASTTSTNPKLPARKCPQRSYLPSPSWSVIQSNKLIWATLFRRASCTITIRRSQSSCNKLQPFVLKRIFPLQLRRTSSTRLSRRARNSNHSLKRLTHATKLKDRRLLMLAWVCLRSQNTSLQRGKCLKNTTISGNICRS